MEYRYALGDYTHKAQDNAFELGLLQQDYADHGLPELARLAETSKREIQELREQVSKLKDEKAYLTAENKSFQDALSNTYREYYSMESEVARLKGALVAIACAFGLQRVADAQAIAADTLHLTEVSKW